MELDLDREGSLRVSCCLLILTCFCHVSHRSGCSPKRGSSLGCNQSSLCEEDRSQELMGRVDEAPSTGWQLHATALGTLDEH